MQVPDSGFQSAAVERATATFLQAIQAQKDIYNGTEHIVYQPGIEGYAYFGSKDWQSGDIQFDGVLYRNEFILYDQYKNSLVVKRPNGFSIELRNEKVDWFAVAGHIFIYITSGNEFGLKPGYYDKLTDGALVVLAKREKSLEDRLEDTRAFQKFTEKITYYAIKSKKSHNIRNLGSLLELTGNRRGEIQQYLKKQGIKYKKNQEAALVAAARLYNKISS